MIVLKHLNRGIPERDIGFKVSSLRSRTLGIKQNIYARNLLRSGIRFSDILKIQRSQRLGNLPGCLKTEGFQRLQRLEMCRRENSMQYRVEVKKGRAGFKLVLKFPVFIVRLLFCKTHRLPGF